jgi:hypothetical protein
VTVDARADNIGVCSRAGAAMFVTEQALVA